ncbi:hypothetical protein PYJP_09240 [Pyrofollis japonicus]|uniref:radical SAM protein n=1 Tax=Pyrofollis japonicus TaxID=3060460 RepID=UPI00295AFA7B|nr:radical SAM protein [Pyrofollis japonicus]BEP17572.1 hypothetical protein PYJP_09240 [Pyrofollis japonicus]
MEAATSLVRRLEELLKLKSSLASRLESELSQREIEQARNDHHAKRRPRPCGMTIHTGIGCNLGCLYCYVPDMGFPMKPKPYPLNGKQLVYALLMNKYFVPGPHGTLLAFGSVTEPFLPETKERALEYIEATYHYLRNPQQISTKSILSDEDIDKLVRVSDPNINVLITIVTINFAKKLEPAAPSPEKRLDFASKLISKGISVTLFMRPIIPGVTDREAENILSLARKAGIRTVVLGSLRVTPGIIKRLKASGVVDIREILKRLPRNPRSDKDQATIVENDIKDRIAKLARKLGLIVLPSSCSANVYSHKMWCYGCKWGPCGISSREIRYSVEELIEAAEALGCKKPRVHTRRTRPWLVELRCKDVKDAGRVAAWLETLLRREVVVSRY